MNSKFSFRVVASRFAFAAFFANILVLSPCSAFATSGATTAVAPEGRVSLGDGPWPTATGVLAQSTNGGIPVANALTAADYLTEADEATPELVALARALGNDPLRMLEWVRNNVEFVPYYGLKRGAHMTYLERSGNDFDQCALLMALLKTTDAVASYRFGDVYVATQRTDGFDAEHWLGADASEMDSILQVKDGIKSPVSPYPTDLSEIKVRRVWIEAMIKGQTKVLDPAFKPRTRTSPVSVDGNTTTYTAMGVWNSAGGYDQPAYVQNLDVAALRTKLGAHTVELTNYLRTSRHSDSGATVAGVGEGQPAILTALPDQLHPACRIDGTPETWSGIPKAHALKFRLSVGTISLPDLYTAQLKGRKLAVWVSDRRFEVWLGDDLHWDESGTPPTSDDATLTFGFEHPVAGGPSPISTRSISRSQKAVVIVYAFDRTVHRLREALERQALYVAEGKSANERQLLTENLNVLGLANKSQTEALSDIYFSVNGGYTYTNMFGGLFHQNSSPKVDIPIDVGVYKRRTSGGRDPADTFILSGFIASALEHLTLEQFGPGAAFSTSRMLEHAMTFKDHPVYLLNSSNYATYRGGLEYFDGVFGGDESTITAALNAGGKLLIPKNSNMTFLNTTGGAYYLQVADFGGRWQIAGGLFGGRSAENGQTDGEAVAKNTNNSEQKNKSGENSLDPVDLATGAFLTTSTDLTTGNIAEPLGLRLTRSYSSARRSLDPVGLGRGWTHNYDIRLQQRSPNDLDIRRASTAEVAPFIVASRIMTDLFDRNGSAKKYVVAAVIANWAVDQLLRKRMSVTLGDGNYEFVVLPNGTFAPRGSIKAELTQSGDGLYRLNLRHGNSIRFRSSDNRFDRIYDTFGNELQADYTTQGKISWVKDAYGRKFQFNYSGDKLTTVDEIIPATTTRTVEYTSDANGLMVNDTEGKTTTYKQDEFGRITEVEDARERTVVRNFYDDWHRVYQQYILGDSTHLNRLWIAPGVGTEVDATGKAVWTYFDERMRKIFVVDQVGNKTQWLYDGADRLTEVVTPLAEITSYTYNADHNLVTETNPVGDTRTIQYDVFLRPWKVSNFEGQITEFGYNSQHKVTSITAPGRIVSTFDYNVSGDGKGQLSKAHPAAYEDRRYDYYTYDSWGNIDTVKHGVANAGDAAPVDNYDYTARGDLKQIIDRRGVKTTFGYNNRRQRTTVTQWDGTTEIGTTTTTYDDAGDVSVIEDASGRKTSTEHNALGDVTQVKSGPLVDGLPTQIVLSNTYNTRNLLETSTVPYDGVNRVTTYTYHDTQKLLSVTTPLGNSPLVSANPTHTTTFGYDADQRPSTTTTPLGFTSIVAWDSRGFKDYESDGEDQTADYGYDKDGRLKTLGNRRYLDHKSDFTWDYDDAFGTVTTKTPLLKTTVSKLDTRGLPLSIQRPSDPVDQPSITFAEYDAEGRLTKKRDRAGETLFTYHANGLLHTVKETPKDSEGLLVTGSAKTTTRTYDALNRLQSYEDGEGNTISYTYYPSGELKEIVYPGDKTVTYTYDDFGRLWKVQGWGATNNTTTYTYWENGLLKKIERPNGTVREQSYDAAGRLRFVRETKAGSFFAFQELTYDADGRITKSFLHPMPAAITLPLDTLDYDADNRLSSFNGDTTVAYDADGNLTRGPDVANGTVPGADNFTYDPRNRLTGHNGTYYRYNPDGLRVEATGTGAATYVVDPNAALSRTLMRTKGGVTTYYIYGLGLLYECDAAGSNTRYYHADQVGSTVALTDAAGNVTDRWSYSPFGTEFRVGSGTSDTPFRFNGEFGCMTEASGLVYMRARFYHPRLMRFLNADPIGFEGGLNWYTYASNDPVLKTDPAGLTVRFGPDLSSADKAGIIQIVNLNLGSTDFAAAWSQLVTSPHPFIIVTHTLASDSAYGRFTSDFNTGGGKISVNLELVAVTGKGDKMYPNSTFAHETDHARRYDTSPKQYWDDEGAPANKAGPNAPNRLEQEAVEFENAVARQLGLPVTNAYPRSDPDAHSDITRTPIPPKPPHKP